MKCFYCGSNMKNVNDVNDIALRIDWLECPYCKSTAEIVYADHGTIKKRVIWDKGEY